MLSLLGRTQMLVIVLALPATNLLSSLSTALSSFGPDLGILQDYYLTCCN